MELSYVHKFVPAENADERRTLLLLHGTGGNENDMISVGKQIAPGAALLSPRGNVLENGNARFFRRFSEGVFDLSDLRARADELADFVQDAASSYGFDWRSVTAVGYSNGANMAATLLLLHPEILAGAALFRAMVPLVPEILPDLRGVPVLIAAGKQDKIAKPGDSEQLVGLLEQCGVALTTVWTDAGHELTDADVEAAREWFNSRQE